MRIVATAVMLLLIATALPAEADRLSNSDECYNAIRPEEGPTCLRFAMDPRVPTSVRDETGQHVFLWLEVVDCRSGTVCTSWFRPNSKNAFTDTPAVVGILYGDTNTVPGLQREAKNLGGKLEPADAVILA